MQHEDQHNESIKSTVKIKNSVSCAIFDDKIKEAGYIGVEKGVITIRLNHGFSMSGQEASKELLIGSIKLGLEQCYDARPDAFDPHAL